MEHNRHEKKMGKKTGWYDYVNNISYREHILNVAEYEEEDRTYCFRFLTDLSLHEKNIEALVESGRKRWKIENEGFNTQKKQGYCLEHRYSKDYQATKNHYYLIQIGHMISQLVEAWEKLWEKVKQSREQKHCRLLEAWKTEEIGIYWEEIERKIQIRFG